MNIKFAINRGLAKLGYALVRRRTVAQLIERPRAHESVSSPSHQPQPARITIEKAPRVESIEETSIETILVTTAQFAAEAAVIDTRLRLKRAANDPPRMCTMLAPRFHSSEMPGRIDRHILEFQGKGITIISTDAAKAAAWRVSEVFDRDVGNLHPSWDWAGNSVYPYSEALRTGLPSPSLIEDLRTLFTGSDFEAFFRGVLGCTATICNCRLVQSLPHSDAGVGPQSWHQDGCPPGVIRGVLYLTDVDERNGPFQYKDEAGGVQTVVGHTGDLLIFDAMRLRHRALPPTHNVRAAIDLVFMPRLPGQVFQIVVSGMNHWPADPFAYSIPKDRRAIA